MQKDLIRGLTEQQNKILSQLEKLKREIQERDKEKSRLNYLYNSIDELKGELKDNEVLSQFGEGIFIKTKLKDIKSFIVNVGSNVFVEKDKKGLKKSLEKLKERSKKERKKIEENYETLREQYKKTNKDIQNLKNNLKKTKEKIK
ncbi:MAG: prefoldin subunit alpha [Candidatus Woesearchaeota archaeon]